MQQTTLPSCPPWPWTWEQDRIDAVSARDALLRDGHEKVLVDFLAAVWGPVKQAAVGILDTSWNPLRTLCQQMSTPGLYSVRPTVRGPEGTEGLIGPRGLLDRAQWAPSMQHLEYLTRGLGDTFLRPSVKNGRLSLALVSPWAVHVETDPADPSRAVELWELCLYRDQEGKRCWVWEVWDIGDEASPSWRVLSADQVGRDGKPLQVANLFFAGVPAEGLSGESYAWRYASGEPFIPHVHYRSKILPGFWSWETLRGLHRGSLHSARLANGLLHAADVSAQRVVLLLNCAPSGSEVVNVGGKGALRTTELLPGSMQPLIVIDPQQEASWGEVGPGMDLVGQWSVVRSYMLSMLASHGLRESDVIRAEANPTSAAALVISDASRREAQRQLAPLFEESDRELIRKLAALARVHGLGDYPDDDVYSVSYSMIEKTSDEMQSAREEQDFELQHGLTSKVELLMKRRGIDRETAIQELKRVQQDERELEVVEGPEEVANTEPTTGASDSPAVEPVAVESAPAPVADAALNGAQMEGVLSILQSRSAGLLSEEGALAMIRLAIPTIADEVARAIVSGVQPASTVAPVPTA